MGETSTQRLSKLARHRLRQTLRHHAARGWQRIVFAKPGATQDDALDVSTRTETGLPSAEELDALVQQAEQAAHQGRVKQTLVIDDTRRVRIDARDGRGKQQSLTEDTLRKAMGGKARPLRPDRSAPLLRVIGIMNADGTISTQHAKKYKQSTHLVELARPVWEAIERSRTVDAQAPVRMLDLACGNGYFTFILAEALRLRGIPSVILGVDAREDVIARCRARAATLEWDHVHFECGTIDDLDPRKTLAGTPDLVVALHACDTATDDALAVAVRYEAPAILAAPCCQREIAHQLTVAPAQTSTSMPTLIDQGLLRRNYGALLTDAMRIDALAAWGYTVQTLEFVGSEHTSKNLLIRALASSTGIQRCPDTWDTLAGRAQSLGISPRIIEALG